MIFVGIDPGKEGAIAWMDGERQHIEVRDCPLVGDEYDWRGMSDILDGLPCLDTVVTIEAVHSMPSDGRRAAFTFGKGYGAWLALIGSAIYTPATLVDPKTWKRAMLAGVANSPGTEALVLEQRFRGHIDPKALRGPKGALKDGRVDAIWLAEYGRTHWTFRRTKS